MAKPTIKFSAVAYQVGTGEQTRTASTETSLTLGNGIDNDSEKPDSDWQNKTARFTLIRDSVEYPLSFTFLNA